MFKKRDYGHKKIEAAILLDPIQYWLFKESSGPEKAVYECKQEWGQIEFFTM